jgi:hypothetical protein
MFKFEQVKIENFELGILKYCYIPIVILNYK